MRKIEWTMAVVLGLWGLGCGGPQAPVQRARYEPPPTLPPYEPPAKKGDPLDALDELEAAAKAEQDPAGNVPNEGAESGADMPAPSGSEGNSGGGGPKEPESAGPSP